MFDTILQLIKLFTDKTVKWTTKSATFIFIIIGLWLLNDTFDFLHSFKINNKLQQLDKIRLLIRDTTLTDLQKSFLLSERQMIFENKTVLDYCYSLFSSLTNISFINHKITDKIITTEKSNINLGKIESAYTNNRYKKNYWLHFIVSNFFLIILTFLSIYSLFKETTIQKIALFLSIIIILIIASVVGYIIDSAFNAIPIILNKVWINYILVFILQGIIWTFFIFMMTPKSYKK